MSPLLTRSGRFALVLGIAVVTSSWGAPRSAQPGRIVIVQTNAAGDDISLIDAATNTVAYRIS